jgi:hypothetical protein
MSRVRLELKDEAHDRRCVVDLRMVEFVDSGDVVAKWGFANEGLHEGSRHLGDRLARPLNGFTMQAARARCMELYLSRLLA